MMSSHFLRSAWAKPLATEAGSSLAENARTLALINMGMSDGPVTVMETRYFYTRWRPETAMRAGDIDGNPRTDADPAYMPFIITPVFRVIHPRTRAQATQLAKSCSGSSPIGPTRSYCPRPRCLACSCTMTL